MVDSLKGFLEVPLSVTRTFLVWVVYKPRLVHCLVPLDSQFVRLSFSALCMFVTLMV